VFYLVAVGKDSLAVPLITPSKQGWGDGLPVTAHSKTKPSMLSKTKFENGDMKSSLVYSYNIIRYAQIRVFSRVFQNGGPQKIRFHQNKNQYFFERLTRHPRAPSKISKVRSKWNTLWT